MTKNIEQIEISMEILREAERAVYVTDGDTRVWLPKSQIKYKGEVGQTVVVSLPEWLAHERGLI